MRPPLLHVRGVQRPLAAHVAHVPVHVRARRTVAALPHAAEGAQLALGLGKAHLGHLFPVNDVRP